MLPEITYKCLGSSSWCLEKIYSIKIKYNDYPSINKIVYYVHNDGATNADDKYAGMYFSLEDAKKAIKNSLK